MSGVLRVRVGGQWVDVLGGTVPPNASWVVNPAQTGPRGDVPTIARFGNMTELTKRVGLFAQSDGTNDIIGEYGKKIGLYTLSSAGGSSYLQVANFAYPTSTLNGWGIGPHPANGAYNALWFDGYPAAGDCVLRSSVAVTTLNARTIGALQIGGGDILLWDTNAVTSYKRTTVSTAPPTESWGYAQLEIAAPNNGTNFARRDVPQLLRPTNPCRFDDR